MVGAELWAWTALTSAILLILDIFTPPYVNFEVLYIGPVFLSLWSVRRSFTYFVATVSTCLVLRRRFWEFD